MKPKVIQPWEEAAKWREKKYLSEFRKKSSPKIRAAILKSMQKDWESATKNGVAEVLHRNGKPIAVFVFNRSNRDMIRGLSVVTFSYSDAHREEALLWIQKRIRANRDLYTKKTMLGTEPDEHWRKVLPRSGFRLHSEILIGETNKAYRNLMKVKNPPATLEHLGLEIRKVKKKSEVDAVIRLQKKVYSRIPEKGFFTHIPSTLKRDYKEYLATTKGGDSAVHGLWRGKKLMGYFLVSVHRDPVWGSSGGFTLTLDFPLQGKGAVKTIYRLGLEHLKKKKIKTFRGGTSQQAVKGLGEIMGRRTQAYMWMWRG